mgnify:CR=1 FL=1
MCVGVLVSMAILGSEYLAGGVLCMWSLDLVYVLILFIFFFFNATSTTEIYTLSLHDALPI